jgi:hypothetical protein
MATYDPKKVRSLINTASAHRMHPGGELAMQLAEQLQAVDEIISAAQQATATAQTATKRAQNDLQTANDELKAAREKVAPFSLFTDTLKTIAQSAKGAKDLAKKALEAAGIKIEAAPTTPTPPA